MKKIFYHPIVVWGISTAVFLLFLWAGMTKLLAPETYADVWNSWGVPSVFVYIVGILEIIGAMVILNPRFAAISSLGLAILMIIASALCFKNGATGPGWTAVIAFGLSFCLSLLRRRDLFYRNRDL